MQRIDLTGRRFGRLTVLKKADHSKKNPFYWICRCDCGAEIGAWGSCLTSGNTRSCGCFRKEIVSRLHKNKIVSKESIEKRLLKMRGRKQSKEHIAKRISNMKANGWVPWNTGKTLSEEHKEKCRIASINNKYALGLKHTVGTRRHLSEKLKGENGPNWRGGINEINDTIRKSVEYKIWREQVFERDDYACRPCGVKSEKGNYVYIEAHHILPFSEFPELRFDVNNGETLCSICHDSKHFSRRNNVYPLRVELR